jgi:uncharacterized protein YjbI with pentapeptide repeats
MSKSNVLAERWYADSGAALADEVLARLVAGSDLGGLSLGEHEGRVDLRFMPAPIPERLERFEALGWFTEKLGNALSFRDVELANLDLSGAQLPSLRFHGVSVLNCRFDGAACGDWRLWSSTVTDCSFRKADLRGAAVGTWHDGLRNEWRRIDFVGADFRVGVTRSAAYEDCDFSGAKVVSVDFSQCSFSRCRFAGPISKVLFEGSDLSPERPAPPQMIAVDFSDAVFRDVYFRGFDLEDVIMPMDPDVRVYRRARCVARWGVSMLGNDDSQSARMLRAVFKNRLRGPGDEREASIFNRRDFLTVGGQELVELADDILDQAEAECLGSKQL